MAVSLQKGQKVSLTKSNPGLSKVMVGLGWDEAPQKAQGVFGSLFGGGKTQDIDCDATAILLQGGKLRGKQDIVYFGSPSYDRHGPAYGRQPDRCGRG